MAKRISAKISAPGREPYRLYASHAETADWIDDYVTVWTKDTVAGGYRLDRFNGGVFSRDWVRALFADSSAETKVEF